MIFLGLSSAVSFVEQRIKDEGNPNTINKSIFVFLLQSGSTSASSHSLACSLFLLSNLTLVQLSCSLHLRHFAQYVSFYPYYSLSFNS